MFFLLIQSLQTFWAERELILRILIFWICVGSQLCGFPGSQITIFSDVQALPPEPEPEPEDELSDPNLTRAQGSNTSQGALAAT